MSDETPPTCLLVHGSDACALVSGSSGRIHVANNGPVPLDTTVHSPHGRVTDPPVLPVGAIVRFFGASGPVGETAMAVRLLDFAVAFDDDEWQTHVPWVPGPDPYAEGVDPLGPPAAPAAAGAFLDFVIHENRPIARVAFRVDDAATWSLQPQVAIEILRWEDRETPEEKVTALWRATVNAASVNVGLLWNVFEPHLAGTPYVMGRRILVSRVGAFTPAYLGVTLAEACADGAPYRTASGEEYVVPASGGNTRAAMLSAAERFTWRTGDTTETAQLAFSLAPPDLTTRRNHAINRVALAALLLCQRGRGALDRARVCVLNDAGVTVYDSAQDAAASGAGPAPEGRWDVFPRAQPSTAVDAPAGDALGPPPLWFTLIRGLENLRGLRVLRTGSGSGTVYVGVYLVPTLRVLVTATAKGATAAVNAAFLGPVTEEEDGADGFSWTGRWSAEFIGRYVAVWRDAAADGTLDLTLEDNDANTRWTAQVPDLRALPTNADLPQLYSFY